MKPKQLALFALVAWIGVTAWVGSMVLAKPRAFPTGYADADESVTAQIQLEIQQIEALAAALSTLQQVPRTASSGPIIALPPGGGRGTGRAAEAASGFAVAASDAEPAPRVVTFILSGEGIAAKAMIDGVLVGTGARLGDGAVVRRIDPRVVHIRDAEGVPHALPVRTPSEPPAGESRP